MAFALSYRDVEELLAERGAIVTYETVRQWCREFGQAYANELRRRRSRPGDTWHLDAVLISIDGMRHYLWRAVDQDGNVLDILVQSRRDKRAAVAVAADGTLAVAFELRRLGCGYEPQQPEGTQYAIGAEINRTIVVTATFVVSGGGRSCFAETGFCAQGRILEYRRAHGGLAINGYPISDEFDQRLEDGNTYQVQYFERPRFELHPENAAPSDVLLGQFGRRIPAERAPGAATARLVGGSRPTPE